MLAVGMVAQGHEVYVIVPRAMKPGPARLTIDGFHVEWCYVPRQADDLYGDTSIRRMRRWFNSRIRLVTRTSLEALCSRFDWVIYYAPWIEQVPSALLARLAGKKIAGMFGDIRYIPDGASLEVRFLQQTAKWADAVVSRLSSVIIIGGSAELEEQFRQQAPRARFIRVPPPVDVSLFASGRRHIFRKKCGAGDSDLVVYSGGLREYEGVSDLAEAMSYITAEQPQARLVIAGTIPSAGIREHVLTLFERHSLGSQAVLVENLSLSEVIDLLAAADILVIPKTQHVVNRAAMPIKLAEYLAAGRPVVASSIGDIPVYLRHRQTALLYQPGNVRQLADSISELLSDKELGARLGRDGQKLAKDVFDIQPVVSRILGAMEQSDSGKGGD